VTAQQPPIAFVLGIDRARLDAAHRHSVRGAVRVQGQVRWLSELRPVDVAPLRNDVGSLRLQPFTHPGGFASTLDCGGRRLVIGFIGAQMRLSEGTQSFDLDSVPGSRSSRFERAGEPSTFVQTQDRSATESLQGQLLPPCVLLPPR
jgi:Type III secretion system lipoprotein chaperone (YscW)